MASHLIGASLFVYFIILVFTIFLIRFYYRTQLAELQKLRNKEREKPSTKYYREKCEKLEQRDVERKLYLELNRMLSKATSFDELACGCVDIVCDLLGATKGALLWRNGKIPVLDFKYTKGYESLADFRLPLTSQSFAGNSIMKQMPLYSESPQTNTSYQPIPNAYESNVLCVPVKMFKDYHGVLRIANIDTTRLHAENIELVFKEISPIIGSGLEKVLTLQENTRRKKEFFALNGISQSLQKTLDIKEICGACARHLKPVFEYSFCTIVRYGEDDTLDTLVAIPRQIKFADNPAGNSIALRNLLRDREPLLIEDIRQTKRVQYRFKEFTSLLSTPLYIQGKPFGAVVVTSPFGTTFNSYDMNVLTMLAGQMSITIERALHFGEQENQATRDGLTGLFNHRVFVEKITQELQRSVRYKRPFSLLLTDIDHFKKFNDTYGHQTGDMVLRAVASALEESGRKTDMAFRYGGEEFCMLLPETPLEKASIFAQRLNAKIRNNKVPTPFGDLQVTISIGVAEAGAWCKNYEMLVEGADKALYKAKDSGRDRVCLYRGTQGTGTVPQNEKEVLPDMSKGEEEKGKLFF